MTVTQPVDPVPLWRLFLKLGGWWVIVLGVQLIFVTIASSFALSLAKRFEVEGRQATAVVTDRYTTQSTDSDGNTTTTYWLSLEYPIRTGETIVKDTTVRIDRYRAVEVGDTLELLYLESAPERIEVEPGSNREASGFMQILALVLGIAWLILLWIVGRWAVAAVRARRYGRRETAVLSDVTRTNFRVFGRRRMRLVWHDAAGREGRSFLQHPDRVSGFGPGDEIVIYQGIKHAYWVGDVGERDASAQAPARAG